MQGLAIYGPYGDIHNKEITQTASHYICLRWVNNENVDRTLKTKREPPLFPHLSSISLPVALPVRKLHAGTCSKESGPNQPEAALAVPHQE
mmetsp:Transcript_4259/g.5350  ORF Transcript_4259/g.5350 Transcript_4259/m.5350 type:complete len:91 (-) Transcript_4259:102-374(-)